MGAYFQVPHAAPRQLQMEIHFSHSETNVSPMGTARSYHSCCHFLFRVIQGWISILNVASKWHQNYMSKLLHGCMFPGSPLPHLDNDQWKHTMFTNKFCISAHHFDKISGRYNLAIGKYIHKIIRNPQYEWYGSLRESSQRYYIII